MSHEIVNVSRVPDGVLISQRIIIGAYLYITINPHSAIDRDIAGDNRTDILSSIIPSPIRPSIELSPAISDPISDVESNASVMSRIYISESTME